MRKSILALIGLGADEPLGTATTLLAADQTILHDREHPSALILPVVTIQPIAH
jgi:hypothetical protein